MDNTIRDGYDEPKDGPGDSLGAGLASVCLTLVGSAWRANPLVQSRLTTTGEG
jgi:hypothetical protein